MASKAFLIAVLLAMVAVPSFATDYIVGDDSGWKLGFNYTAWAEGKNFYIGDRLIFMYKVGFHNVMKVSGTDFQQCATYNKTGSLASGNDMITLASPGKKWYICGVADHCSRGMKLVITVSEAEAPELPPAPAPSPYSYSNSRIFNRFSNLFL